MAFVAVLFLLVGIFRPASRTLVEKVETNRQRTIVFDPVSGSHNSPGQMLVRTASHPV